MAADSVQEPPSPYEPTPPGFTFRRFLAMAAAIGAAYLAYVLRGVLVPLFFAFLLAYALAPIVQQLEKLKFPRALAAITVMLGLFLSMLACTLYVVPLFLDEIRAVGETLPFQLGESARRLEPWVWSTFHIKVPHTLGELSRAYGDKIQAQLPSMLSAGAIALFGTLSYVAVIFSALVVPLFALYLLIDFDRIVSRAQELIPRRWVRPVSSIARQVHETLGSYIRGQLTANIVLSALYAVGLRIVDIRLAVPIGVLTGMLAFVPYVGFFFGLFLALSMALLDWHGIGPVLGVLGVMGLVQVADGLIVTPRIVGGSVGLGPLEVLLTMSAAASLLGFTGVLLAVPMGAVLKILVGRLTKSYLRSDFYLRRPAVTTSSGHARVATRPSK